MGHIRYWWNHHGGFFEIIMTVRASRSGRHEHTVIMLNMNRVGVFVADPLSEYIMVKEHNVLRLVLQVADLPESIAIHLPNEGGKLVDA